VADLIGMHSPLRNVVGGRTAAALAEGLNLHTAEDALKHYPRRYAERGEMTDFSSLTVGDYVTVMAEVFRVQRRTLRSRKGLLLEVTVTDGHQGAVTLTFFHQPWRERELTVGRRGLFAGKVGSYRGVKQLVNPDYQLLDGEDAESENAAAPTAFASAVIPVYPATTALPSWRVAQCVRLVLDAIDPAEYRAAEVLPEELRRRHDLVDIATAITMIHRPETRVDVTRGRRRMVWEEAFILQVALARRRAALDALPAVPRPLVHDGILDAFDRQLPFSLTVGQREVFETIAADVARDSPMHRLFQGEVGSGKTVVALRAMLAVIDTGGQAALLAPTEVLAQQHYRSIVQLLGPLASGGQLGSTQLATRVALLTGSLPAAPRRAALDAAASGTAGILIGTHALIQDAVSFHDLGLVVIDEQHRFGVEQRDALRHKAGKSPHLLVMTATPIPRTVAMTIFGDLEVSTLRELPGNRASTETFVVPAAEKPSHAARVWHRLREEVTAGRQGYVVCPRIDSDDPPVTAQGRQVDPDAGERPRRPPLAVTEVADELRSGPLAGVRIEVLHGRLAPDLKEDVMKRFGAGDIDVVVATTVVEVGLDVPNASVMVVLDADRFGMSQLHQLRGRVGRGRHPGLCLLVTEAENPQARARLDAVAATSDGFTLSTLDLKQRREGDVLGAAQSGRRSSLALLSVLRHGEIIEQAKTEATNLVAADPDLQSQPELAAVVCELMAEDRADFLDRT
jgi:ATP-dependent DNA helicase RecG